MSHIQQNKSIILSQHPNGNIKETYREVKIGRTLYRVTSTFPEEGKQLQEILENLAVRQITAELIQEERDRLKKR